MSTRASAPAARVRFGGMQTARGYVFELTGGHLCLDLANTIDERGTSHPRELLPRYEDLLAWGVQAKAVRPTEAAALRRHAASHRVAASETLARVAEVREAIFRLFSAVADRRVAPADALAVLNRNLPQALGGCCLERRGLRFAWRWRQAARPELDRVLWPVVVSAADLLTSSQINRVRRCAGAGCAWLFIDTSRNRTRRWCDMSVCGNRAKARRHYAKSLEIPSPAARTISPFRAPDW
jgi:predicted RNA-binding Zn ribbon-like protein